MDPVIFPKVDLSNDLLNKMASKNDKVDEGILNDGHFPRFIKWVREPSETGWDVALKIGLVALTVLAALSIVGLIVVIPGMIMGGIEWNRQIQVVQLPQVPVKNSNTEQQEKKKKPKRGEFKIASGKTENKKEIDQASLMGIKGQNSNVPIEQSSSHSNESASISSSEDSSKSIPEIISTELVLNEVGRVEVDEIILSKINVIQLRELLISSGISFVTLTHQPFNVNAYWKLRIHSPKSESKELPKMLSITAMEFSEGMEKAPRDSFRVILNENQFFCEDHSLMSDKPPSAELQVEELPDDWESLNSESSLEEVLLMKNLDDALQEIMAHKIDNQDDGISSALVVPQNIIQVLNPNDEKSLKNLAQIKKNQVIDVYENDVVSEPYDDVENSYIWGGVLWLRGYGTNSDEDIAKIENLMNRSLDVYFKGCKSVKPQLKDALKGLGNLSDHYLAKGRSSTSDILVGIINDVELSLKPKQQRVNKPLMLLDV